MLLFFGRKKAGVVLSGVRVVEGVRVGALGIVLAVEWLVIKVECLAVMETGALGKVFKKVLGEPICCT